MTAMRQSLPIDAPGAWPEFRDAPPARASRRIYAIGDVHGDIDLLGDMHAAICDDLARHPATRPLIVHLGDLIDRGPHSNRVIDAVIALCERPPAGAEAMSLRGNHDNWLAGFLTDSTILPTWAPKGGLETLLSYGFTPEAVFSGLASPASAEKVRERFLEVLPERHKEFMLGLPLCHSDGDYFFAHAGVDPDRSLADQTIEDLTWIRDKFLNSRKHFGKVVVHGHTARAFVESLPNRINVDTGIYIRQVLSCVVLDGTERHLLQVGNVSIGKPALAGEPA
ncbi:MAG TPA: metallophosphoesterase family protein [Devosiaceae bacterium]|jgi:serine/threonine protein phosphatase 1